MGDLYFVGQGFIRGIGEKKGSAGASGGESGSGSGLSVNPTINTVD